MKIIIDEIKSLPEEERYRIAKIIVLEINYMFLSTDIKTLKLEHNCTFLENMFPSAQNMNIEAVKKQLPEGLQEANVFIINGMMFVENKKLEEGTIQPLEYADPA